MKTENKKILDQIIGQQQDLDALISQIQFPVVLSFDEDRYAFELNEAEEYCVIINGIIEEMKNYGAAELNLDILKELFGTNDSSIISKQLLIIYAKKERFSLNSQSGNQIINVNPEKIVELIDFPKEVIDKTKTLAKKIADKWFNPKFERLFDKNDQVFVVSEDFKTRIKNSNTKQIETKESFKTYVLLKNLEVAYNSVYQNNNEMHFVKAEIVDTFLWDYFKITILAPAAPKVTNILLREELFLGNSGDSIFAKTLKGLQNAIK